MDRGRQAVILMWCGFIAFVLIILAVDLGLLNRRAQAPTIARALAFAGGTAVLAVAFSAFVYAAYSHHWAGLGSTVDSVDGRANDGRVAALKFLTGYVVEISLSMDNVFVIALIFENLRVPVARQHRVLFWGVLGALVMRGAMIGGGAALVARYHWILYAMGAFLLFTGVRMLNGGNDADKPEASRMVRFLNRHFRVTREFHGGRFRIAIDGRQWITPLLVALMLVESTDLVFAVDSIPAIFAITTDAFLVFTSNVFAILCLRSLYFGLAGMLARFRYLKASLAVILGLIGVKMLASYWNSAPLGDATNLWTLGVVAAVLAMGAAASALIPERPGR